MKNYIGQYVECRKNGKKGQVIGTNEEGKFIVQFENFTNTILAESTLKTKWKIIDDVAAGEVNDQEQENVEPLENVEQKENVEPAQNVEPKENVEPEDVPPTVNSTVEPPVVAMTKLGKRIMQFARFEAADQPTFASVTKATGLSENVIKAVVANLNKDGLTASTAQGAINLTELGFECALDDNIEEVTDADIQQDIEKMEQQTPPQPPKKNKPQPKAQDPKLVELRDKLIAAIREWPETVLTESPQYKMFRVNKKGFIEIHLTKTKLTAVIISKALNEDDRKSPVIEKIVPSSYLWVIDTILKPTEENLDECLALIKKSYEYRLQPKQNNDPQPDQNNDQQK